MKKDFRKLAALATLRALALAVAEPALATGTALTFNGNGITTLWGSASPQLVTQH